MTQEQGQISTSSPGIAQKASFGEELANSISHGLAMLAAIIAAPILIIAAVREGSAWEIVGASVFSATMIILYLTSTLYHALPHSKTKELLKVLDHGAIFLLIAGTYTPFTLGVLRGTWGWTLFGLVWSMALIGVVVKVRNGARDSWFSTALYLIMGWLIIIAIKPMLMHVSAGGLLWLLAGGLAYTFGVIFFALDGKVRYAHFIWHLFVILGTTCHFFAVLWHSS